MEESITQKIRDNLTPQGALSIVKLTLGNMGYVDYRFVLKCIGEIDGLAIRQVVGGSISNLERLALMLLMDSASINIPTEEELKQKKALS